ncbi:MAG TPA: DUF6134 family protein [Gammaproteobacteria bacterium]|nr:DUF6134 family protein [Gammaproteobacteria bacterium]
MRPWRATTALLLALPGLALTADREWRFRVYLDDKEIGYHAFELSEIDQRRRIEIEAQFEYKLLFVKLFEYSHRNTEIWSGDCLSRIEATTEANGNPLRVRGGLADDTFVVEGTTGRTELPACVMTFAYWNPDFLRQRQLLDPQTGELLEIEVSAPERVEIEVRGAKQAAWRYRLEVQNLGIELWYSAQREWLALEAEAVGGRKLRYELI